MKFSNGWSFQAIENDQNFMLDDKHALKGQIYPVDETQRRMRCYNIGIAEG